MKPVMQSKVLLHVSHPNDSKSKLLPTRTHPDWGNLYKMTCVCKRGRTHSHGPQLGVDTLPALPLPTILISRECFFFYQVKYCRFLVTKVPWWDKKALCFYSKQEVGSGTIDKLQRKLFSHSLPALTCYDLCVILAMIFNWAHHHYHHCHHHIITLTGYHFFPREEGGGLVVFVTWLRIGVLRSQQSR